MHFSTAKEDDDQPRHGTCYEWWCGCCCSCFAVTDKTPEDNNQIRNDSSDDFYKEINIRALRNLYIRALREHE